MKSIKKIMLVIIALVLIIGVSGCGKVAKLKNGEEAVVKFDKKNVSADELYEELKDNMNIKTLVNLIDKKLFGDKYQLTSSEENKIKDEVKNSSQMYMYYGYTSTDDMEASLIMDKRREKAVKDYLESKVTDKEIEKYYKNNVYGDVKASHILIAVDSTDDMTDKEKESLKKDAKKEANEVITKLKNGEDFEKLAKEYSDDESIDLGWFNDGDMEDSFFKATLALEKNKYTTTPVETSYGYHIILKTGEKKKASLKELKGTIVEKIVEKNLENDVVLQFNAIMDMREEAGMKFQDNEMKKKYKTYMSNLMAQARENAANEKESN